MDIAQVNLDLQLNAAEINTILGVLGNRPFNEVGVLINDIKKQGDAQFQPENAEAMLNLSLTVAQTNICLEALGISVQPVLTLIDNVKTQGHSGVQKAMAASELPAVKAADTAVEDAVETDSTDA